MRRMLSVLLVALFVLVGAGTTARAVDLSMLPGDLQDRVEDLIATRFPPELHSITLDPEEPVAGEPTNIEVEIYNPKDITSDETSTVYVMYSTDFGETWEQIELETDDDKVWYGEFPAFDSGTEVIYLVHAIDSSENVYTTVPCMLMEGEVLDGEKFNNDYGKSDCVNSGDDLSACEDIMPRGCMIRMAVDEEPIDDEEDEIPDDFDILDHRIGYDENYFYIDIAVQGKISQGTMNPTDLHAYVGVIIDEDKVGSGTDIEQLLDAGGVLVHAPLAEMAGGMVKPCFYGYQQGGEFTQDDTAVVCVNKRNHLIFRVSREAVGINDSGLYQFISLGATITNFPDPIDGTVYDNTRVTTTHFTEDTYFAVK